MKRKVMFFYCVSDISMGVQRSDNKKTELKFF